MLSLLSFLVLKEGGSCLLVIEEAYVLLLLYTF
jgi:hypothetical protein